MPPADRRLSFIIPTLDELAAIEANVAALARLLGPDEEIVLVDGGSQDGTVAAARALPEVRVIESERGRARQMNAGARAARGELLVFLHADTAIPGEALGELRELARSPGTRWGFFPIRLAEPGLALRVIEVGVRIRVWAGGHATGDQAIFVRRDRFLALGGFPDVKLMEDVELTRRLARSYAPSRPRSAIVTSGRRWLRGGVVKTQLRMWALRLAWRAGVSPRVLADFYPKVR